MIIARGVDGADHAEVIDAFGEMRIELRDFRPRLPVFVELVRRGHEIAGVAEEDIDRSLVSHRLTVMPRQLRFRVESIDLAHSSIHEEEDDRLCLGGKMRRASG